MCVFSEVRSWKFAPTIELTEPSVTVSHIIKCIYTFHSDTLGNLWITTVYGWNMSLRLFLEILDLNLLTRNFYSCSFDPLNIFCYHKSGAM